MILNSLDIMKPEPFSDEVDSLQGMAKRRKDGERKERKTPQPPPPPPQLGDGASIEIVKRPRGRPPGSKNRPKPPIVITKESEPSAAMRPYVLEIPSGHDIIDSLTRFSRHRKLGICVLAATGAAVNVTIQQAGSEAAIIFHGRFEILSMSATFMPPEMAALPAAAASAGMTLSLAGPHGQVIGGTVAGPLLASGAVMVVAAAFANTTFHRLPLEEEVSVSVSGDDATGEVAAQRQYHDDEQQNFFHHFHLQQPHSSPSPPQPAAESGGMAGIYGSHFTQEMIWPPGGRTPHQPY